MRSSRSNTSRVQACSASIADFGSDATIVSSAHAGPVARAALFPVLERVQIQADQLGDLRLADLRSLANRANVKV
jgi:hypothetical protein